MPDRPADYTFLSAPDFMNSDLADLRELPSWHPGMPNSWNSAYSSTVNTILDTFADENPDDVFVAGDLVEGHWGQDYDHTGVFGPVDTEQEKQAALRRAARFYFSHWRDRFDQRDLSVYPAIGDHDIGDNPWAGGKNPAATTFKRTNMDLFKAAFSRYAIGASLSTDRPAGPAHDTAYATYLSPDVLLVSVNVFCREHGNVTARLDHQQLAWLNRVLTTAETKGTDWIVVQGHVPVLTPVRTYGSSAMSYDGGRESPFWQTMARHHVDIYLNGEVHDVTMRRADGITQISHGGTVQMANPSSKGSTNYVLAQIFGNRMWVRDNRFYPKMVDSTTRLWQTSKDHRPVAQKRVWDHPPVIAHAVLTSDNRLVYSDGAFLPYTG